MTYLCHLRMLICGCYISYYSLIHQIFIDHFLCTGLSPAAGDPFLNRAQCLHSQSECFNREERKISRQLQSNELLVFLGQDQAQDRMGPHLTQSLGFKIQLPAGHDMSLTIGLYIICSFCLEGKCTEMTVDINVSFICCYSSLLTRCQTDPCWNQTCLWTLQEIIGQMRERYMKAIIVQ